MSSSRLIKENIKKHFTKTYNEFPDSLKWVMNRHQLRLLWLVEKVCETIPEGGRILDLGGGITPLMKICQDLGYQTEIVDDFDDDMYKSKDAEYVISEMQKSGVKIIRGDLLSEDNSFSHQKLDMVMSHSCMEHLHNSPKSIFYELWSRLDKNGIFWIGVPNRANLRKRFAMLFGGAKWSSMQEWYEEPIFRGHVREPDVEDLLYIGENLGASKIKIIGKNWMGYRNDRFYVRKLTPYIDRLLQFRPSLCSDIYLLATK